MNRKGSMPLLPRRAILRAAGASMALPFLPGGRASAQPQAFPRRFVVYHVPEGVPVDDGDIFANTPDYWWPNEDLSKFPESSAPMAKHKDRLLFVKGLGSFGDDKHVDGMKELLTGNLDGAPERTAGTIKVPGGMSLDQILAQHLGAGTPYKSYGVGILNHHEGVQEKRRISYAGPSAGRDPINNPLKVYDDLLANVGGAAPNAGPSDAQRRLLADKTVIDSLKKELGAVRCGLGQDGRRKLDAYLTGVRDIESRLAEQLKAGEKPRVLPMVERPGSQGNESFWGALTNAPAIGDLQMRLAATALAADVTRVVVFQWNQSVSRQTYPWLPVADKAMGGHDYAHSSALKEDRAHWAAQRAIIFKWYSEQFVRFLDLLADVPEGDGTLLDHTTVLYCSEMGNGHHSTYNQPFILAGSAGRVFAQGRLLDARQGAQGLASWRKPPPNYLPDYYRLHNDLLVAIAQGYGVPLQQIGRPECNGRALTEILAKR